MRTPLKWFGTRVVAMVTLAACGGGGGDGGGGAGTGPVPVSSVVITSPSGPVGFATIGRTRQFTAEPRDASGNVLTGRTVQWQSSATAVASVSATGLVTAQGNGTAQITARVDDVNSSPVAVTVQQVAASVAVSPSSVAFGAIGSMRQLTAEVRDSGGTAITGRTVTWSRAGTGTVADVNSAGVVTALAVGMGDTAVATHTGADGTFAGRAPITVTQVVRTVSVTPQNPDTLRTTGRTLQFSAAAADSNGNPIPGAAFSWASSVQAVASVNSSGLATAGTTDGTTMIQASSGGQTGGRDLVVLRYAETFTLSPTSATITTAGGTQVFNGAALDSSGANLPIAWAASDATIVSVSPTSGASTTATALRNGTTFVVMSAGTRRDSAQVDASNQPSVSYANQIQPIWNTSCLGRGCHTSTTQEGSLVLEAAVSRGNLVNVQAVGGSPGDIRVIPGDADNSYLVRKLEGGPNITGNRMPETGGFLTTSQVQLIRTWILEGAANN